MVPKVMMFRLGIPRFIVLDVVLQVFGEEEGIVVYFTEPFGSVGVMVCDVEPGSPHFLPYVAAYPTMGECG
jgi:hypothetical protein